ncbi:hypothetical protein DRI50_11255 [candidate division KSB1 bacterium]|nr:MAG: hypothetical protein DRI50_11255 [candidate division KSB1 bacterium]
MRSKQTSAFVRVYRREWQRIAEKKTLYMLMLFLPLTIFILLAAIYQNRVVTDLPVAVWDQDNSDLSRMVIRSYASTRSIQINGYVHSLEEIKEQFRSGRIQGALYIPADFSKQIKRGKQARLVFYENASNLVIGNLLLKESQTISQTISAGLVMRQMRALGMSEAQAMDKTLPVRIESKSLYNPAYNYENFLVPGLLPMLLQLMIMVAGVLICSSEYTHNTIQELYRLADSGISAIFWGKSLPHLMVHSATVLGLLGILFPWFGIPFRGSLLAGFVLMELFVMASFFMAMALSTLFHDQFLATEIAVFFNTPAFIFSGYTFPVWAMPGLHQVYAQLMPFTHFLQGFIKLYQMGLSFKDVLPQAVVLVLFILISVVVILTALNYRSRHILLQTKTV